jgi:eukaryotic-like serine/threonine-protein kinase
MPLPEGTRLGSYEVTSALGAGGMGEVYRARDNRLGRDVAIKVLPQAFATDAERLARFVREARTLASLNHPNIAQIYGLEDTGGLPALVMELVEGPTLADRIALGPLPLEEALLVARQLADALDAAHSRGIVHRDLKPANIKLDADHVVKVLDFGLAKLVEREGTTEPIAPAGGTLQNSPTIGFPATTGVGMILGTAAYMSPEQARGRVVDKRADIWAFGVVLYEMLTGERPFTGEDASETIAAVIKETPRWDAVPYLVRPLIQSCLEKDPRRRLRDIGDMWRILDPARGDAALVQERVARSRWLPWAVAAGATVLLMAATTYFLTRPVPSLPSARFTVDAPPPSSYFRFEVTGASVSPDGTQLVFSAFHPAGNSLYVRRLDSLETVPLAGTEDADLPFWSPDGQSIAFFSGGSLKRIELDGGPPVVVCPAAEGFGGTWNREDVILFATAAGLSRVAASGAGEATLLVPAEPAGWRLGHPQFLPDQDHFIYYARDARGEDRQVYGSSLGSPDRRTSILRTAGYQARYAPPRNSDPGRLLYLRDTTLMAQPFDPIALRLTGDAVPIAENVMVLSTDSAAFSVSDTGVLIYRTGELATERSKILWLNRKGETLSEAAPEDFYSSMRISPDGTRVALGRRNIIRQDDQWVLDFSRGPGAMTRLTFDTARETWPVWSPDGHEIAFGANPTGSYELYRKAASGAGAPQQLTVATAAASAGAGKRPSDWSRDGKFLIYTDSDPVSGDNIWALRLDTSPGSAMAIRSSRFQEFDGHLSRDSQWIAYISNESGREEVFVQAFTGDGGRAQASSMGGRAPRWHPNGRELFYYNDESGYLMSVRVSAVNGTITTGTPSQVFPIRLPRGVTAPWDIAPDGERFLVQQLQPRPRRPPLTVVTNWQATVAKPR